MLKFSEEYCDETDTKGWFRHKSCFSFDSRRGLVTTFCFYCFLIMAILYMNTSAECLHMLDSVYHMTWILQIKTTYT